MKFDFDLVGKVGSMALISKQDNDIDYNIFARISRELAPGMIWVSSGATEIGRIDYIKRNGCEIDLPIEIAKTDYSAQGQAILMENYRRFINPNYSVRQVLVEHSHFNNHLCENHLREMLYRCKGQNAVPIINYNDAVSDEENRKLEIENLSKGCDQIVQCIDNDETATRVARLVKSRQLLILSSTEGILQDPNDESTLVKEISGKNLYELIENIDNHKVNCVGSSRELAGGAGAKLEFVKMACEIGTEVIIASSKYKISDILSGKVNSTRIGVR
ncbi:MAG: uridylate kinase [Bacillota bacterium]